MLPLQKILRKLSPDNTFFTSDHHFGHKNIIQYQNRPFENIQQMDEHLINCWNQVVNPSSTVFYLGDFGYNEKCLDVLNGQLILIAGNHDTKVRLNRRWIHVVDYMEINLPMGQNYQKTVLSHFPFLEWNKKHYGSINLHGHCHGKTPMVQINQLDVGIDHIGYTPKNWLEIQSIVSQNNSLLIPESTT